MDETPFERRKKRVEAHRAQQEELQVRAKRHAEKVAGGDTQRVDRPTGGARLRGRGRALLLAGALLAGAGIWLASRKDQTPPPASGRAGRAAAGGQAAKGASRPAKPPATQSAVYVRFEAGQGVPGAPSRPREAFPIPAPSPPPSVSAPVGGDVRERARDLLSRAEVEPAVASGERLGSLGPGAAPAIAALLAEGSLSPTATRVAATALTDLPADRRSLPSLESLLASSDPYVTEQAIWALLDLGAVAAETAPRLRAIAEDEAQDPPVRRAAILTLAKLDPPSGLDLSSRLLGSVERPIRLAALRVLEAPGVELTGEAAVRVGRLATSPDAGVRQDALRLLASRGREGNRTVIDRLAVEAETPEDRAAAVAALGVYADQKAFDRAVDALASPSVRVRISACRALVEQESWAAVPHLIRALHEGPSEVRRTAAWALRQLTGQPLGASSEAWQAWWQTDARLYLAQ